MISHQVCRCRQRCEIFRLCPVWLAYRVFFGQGLTTLRHTKNQVRNQYKTSIRTSRIYQVLESVKLAYDLVGWFAGQKQFFRNFAV